MLTLLRRRRHAAADIFRRCLLRDFVDAFAWFRFRLLIFAYAAYVDIKTASRYYAMFATICALHAAGASYYAMPLRYGFSILFCAKKI